jgi:hypothetical protein
MRAQIPRSRRRDLRRPVLWAALAAAAAAAILSGSFRSFLAPEAPLAILLGLPLGHALLALGHALVSRNRERVAHCVTRAHLVYLPPHHAPTAAFYLLIALAEEILFRIAPLWLWPSVLTALVSSLAFAALHVSLTRVALVRRIDLFLFAAAQCALFLLWRNPYLIVLSHFVRNYAQAKLTPPQCAGDR